MQDFTTSDMDNIWLKRVQENLAKRSVENGSFSKVYGLLRTKRLARLAIAKVLKNKGARTPGVDGKSRSDYESLKSRYGLVEEIISEIRTKRYKPLPVRRVYIPKANGKERPLGIPTIKDRAVQEMLRLILDPIYEGKFYNHSYGFRPHRSAHHAASRLWILHGRFKYDWVVEGDIKACFDEIDHIKLLRILRKTIKDERVIRIIKKMLSAGIVEDESGNILRPKQGTPQGGIVSPLLANVFLNELDQFIAEMYDYKSEHYRTKAPARFIVRYADDFVIVTRTEEDATVVKELVREFLANLGLELSTEKTVITHVEKGYDFLGFNIRRHAGRTFIQPSRMALKKFRRAYKARLELVIHKYGFSVQSIRYLNYLVRGWGNYYKWFSSKRAFKSLDHYIWWANYRIALKLGGKKAPKRDTYLKRFLPMRLSSKARERKYNSRQFGVWIEEGKSAELIFRLDTLPIEYVRFHKQLNPYLGNQELLKKQNGKLPKSDVPEQIMPPIVGGYGAGWQATRQAVLRRDKYRCTVCGRRNNLHIHHVGLKAGTPGAENLDNLTTLCGQCHNRVHGKKSVNSKVA